MQHGENGTDLCLVLIYWGIQVMRGLNCNDDDYYLIYLANCNRHYHTYLCIGYD